MQSKAGVDVLLPHGGGTIPGPALSCCQYLSLSCVVKAARHDEMTSVDSAWHSDRQQHSLRLVVSVRQRTTLPTVRSRWELPAGL